MYTNNNIHNRDKMEIKHTQNRHTSTHGQTQLYTHKHKYTRTHSHMDTHSLSKQ